MRAIEAACGVGPGPAGRVARKLVVDAEALEQTLWRILLDWPRCVGAPADEHALKRLRKQLGALRGGVFADAQWCRPGGVDVSADVGQLLGIVETVADDAAGVLFGAVDPAAALCDRRSFEGWFANARTPTPSVLRWVVSHDRLGFAADGSGPVSELDPESVGERLARDDDGAYCALPDLEGEVPQTGALTRWADAGLVRELQAVYGGGLATQLAARLFEVMALVTALRGHLRQLAREAPEPGPRRPNSPPSNADGRGWDGSTPLADGSSTKSTCRRTHRALPDPGAHRVELPPRRATGARSAGSPRGRCRRGERGDRVAGLGHRSLRRLRADGRRGVRCTR